jgi:UDP-N-acetylglucosamine--N-acetylmuramyl-(pentapeptide) pyrophosphoryl-undecaprenol N-acetylglucosamine transferase
MKVVVGSGGTYGHIAPALGLTSALKEKKIEVVFVSPNKELREYLTKRDISSYFITNPKIKVASIPVFIKSIINFIKAMRESASILLNTKPDIIIGFGGYASFPLVISACILGIPSAIHEQNVAMGKANRILSYFVKRIFLSFGDTKRFVNSRKVLVIGKVIREGLELIDKEDARRHLDLEEKLFTVLVMGGSQGSHKINKKFMEAIEKLKSRSLQVIHLTGYSDFQLVKDYYAKLRIRNKTFDFSENMSYLYSAADLVISRAGASTVTEILYFRIPSILIPYPYAGAHQMDNAKVLAKNGRAIIIEDKDLERDFLVKYLEEFIDHPEKLKKMKEQFENREENFGRFEEFADGLLKVKNVSK